VVFKGFLKKIKQMNQSFGPTIDKALKLLNEPSNEIYKIDLSGNILLFL
jgi:hypothetical protein